MSSILTIRQRLRCAAALVARDAGQTLPEYGALLAVVALIVVIAAVVLGANLSTIFGTAAHRV